MGAVHIKADVCVSGPIVLDANGVNKYFTVASGDYGFAWDGSGFTTTNGGVASSTATTTFTAKYPCVVSLAYSYSSEQRFDKFSFTAVGSTIEKEVSGATTTKSWSGKMSPGQSLVFTYSKDGSGDKNDDRCRVWNFTLTDLMLSDPACKKIYFTKHEGGAINEAKEAYLWVNGQPKLWYAQPVQVGSIPVGSLVQFAVSGQLRNFMIVHQGLPGSVYDLSCDGTWFMMEDVYGTRQWRADRGNNAYEASTINSILNNDFLGMMESETKEKIKSVTIPFRPGQGSGTTAQTGANGLYTKVFLLSAKELNISRNEMPKNEGTALAYFANVNSTGADAKRIGKLNGSPTDWWTRSPCHNYDRVIYVQGDGWCYECGSQQTKGIRPAFILPKTAMIPANRVITR